MARAQSGVSGPRLAEDLLRHRLPLAPDHHDPSPAFVFQVRLCQGAQGHSAPPGEDAAALWRLVVSLRCLPPPRPPLTAHCLHNLSGSTVVLGIISWVVASSVPFFSSLLGLIGSICFGPVALILPAVLWLYTYSDYRRGTLLQKLAYAANVGLFLLGWYITGPGTYAVRLGGHRHHRPRSSCTDTRAPLLHTGGHGHYPELPDGLSGLSLLLCGHCVNPAMFSSLPAPSARASLSAFCVGDCLTAPAQGSRRASL